jgi:integrase
MASIQKVKGKWVAQVCKVGFPRRSKTFLSKSHAISWSKSAEFQLEQNRVYGYDKTLLNDKLSTLIDRYQATKSVFKRSYDKEVYILRKWKATPLVHMRVGDITVTMVSSLVDRWKSEIKPASIRNYCAVLRHIFNVAINEWGYNIDNPVSKVQMPKLTETPIRRLSRDELERLKKIFIERQTKMRWIVTFAMETGMRRGEIVNLKWDDIDRTKNTARVSESKAGRVRFIPLTPTALECLESVTTQSEYVFDTTNNAIACAWKKLRVKAGIKSVRFHDFRHEAISRFFEKGLTIPEVASISGHSTPQMLFRYAHADQSKIAEKLASW